MSRKPRHTRQASAAPIVDTKSFAIAFKSSKSVGHFCARQSLRWRVLQLQARQGREEVNACKTEILLLQKRVKEKEGELHGITKEASEPRVQSPRLARSHSSISAGDRASRASSLDAAVARGRRLASDTRRPPPRLWPLACRKRLTSARHTRTSEELSEKERALNEANSQPAAQRRRTPFFAESRAARSCRKYANAPRVCDPQVACRSQRPQKQDRFC